MVYVRRRRLKGALADLAGSGTRLSVREAARWSFADSSHLVRTCRKRYGQTPTRHIGRHPGATL
ncbi:hypothetical protein Aab01nite_81090 [Paractinoplanes abujensis]|uniref:AraC-like DNA-binding protein n=1 Tax=Paractinoplanes abujensis TaxID=882441 RepID=A0A7W7CU40_9ACTN|nr:AraC-like DNA-binding protein [Actinoplanes abujensis]GID24519.1 hypothetical protein Aab01nite_81090 [Actinoplanes abujensis]